jgi:hypothetical protein
VLLRIGREVFSSLIAFAPRVLGAMISPGCTRSLTAERGTLLVSAKEAGARVRKPSYTRVA